MAKLLVLNDSEYWGKKVLRTCNIFINFVKIQAHQEDFVIRKKERKEKREARGEGRAKKNIQGIRIRQELYIQMRICTQCFVGGQFFDEYC